MKKSENSESEEEIQSVDEVVEQFQSLERIVSPENEPSKVELEELDLEKMRVEEKVHENNDEKVDEEVAEKVDENLDEKVDEKVDEICNEEEIQSNDEINLKMGDKAKTSIYGDIENVDKDDDFDDAFVSTGEGAVLEDDFGGFGEANPNNVFDASFGEFQQNGDQLDGDDDFGDFGETVEAQDENDDFGDFGENDNDFVDFTESKKAAPVQELQSDLEPVSLAPVWEELKDATFYEYEEPKIEFAWEKSRESIDKLEDFLNASALELTWNSSASKKMLDYVMPKFLQLTRDVEKEREAELEKIRKEKEEKSALKNTMSTEAKNLLAQLPDLSYLNP